MSCPSCCRAFAGPEHNTIIHSLITAIGQAIVGRIKGRRETEEARDVIAVDMAAARQPATCECLSNAGIGKLVIPTDSQTTGISAALEPTGAFQWFAAIGPTLAVSDRCVASFY